MRSSALRLLLLIGVRAALHMGGEVQGEGGSRHRRAPARSGVQRGGPSRDETPSGPTRLSNQTTGLIPHPGNLQLISDANATFYTAAPNSSSAADPTDSPTPSTAPPNLLNTSPLSHPAPGPKLTQKNSESSGGTPGASPELYVQSLEPIPSVNPELFTESLDSIQSADSKLFAESLDSIPSVDPKLFSKRHYRSPRVLFSAHPPDDAEGGRVRVRRRANQPRHRGVYSVCDSISKWVGNKTTAIDIKGNEVTVLPNVRINNIVKKQYFFETTCHGGAHRSGRSGGSSCLGIDSRHWNSYCTNTHTFVLAMTSFESLVAWRLVRINAACVCVLSRKSWRH